MNVTKLVRKGVLDSNRESIRKKLSQRSSFIKLDLNENKNKLSDVDFKDFLKGLSPEYLSCYPDLSSTYKKTADFFDIIEDQLLLTTGSDLGIKAVFDTFIEKGNHILIHEPCYTMYEFYSGFFEAKLEKVPVTKSFKPNVNDMVNRIKSNTKMFVIESPSGWLGVSLSISELDEIAALLNSMGVIFVIDEAYFCVKKNQEHATSLITKYNNVIILRTMSKVFGLAGARVGAVISNIDLINQIYKVKPLYEISSLSAYALEWKLSKPELLKTYQDELVKHKEYVLSKLMDLDIICKVTEGNFILIYLPLISNFNLYEILRERNILIGRKFTLPILNDWWRITIGNTYDNKSLVEALKEIKELKLIRD